MCEDDREGGDWGSIGERNASSQDLVTVGESIIRLSSLTDVMESDSFFPKSYCGWGSGSNLKDEMATEDKLLTNFLTEKGISIVTSTAEFPIDWSGFGHDIATECSFAYSTTPVDQYINPQPVKIGDSDIFYIDSPAAKFGDSTAFDLDHEKNMLDKVFKCIRAKTSVPAYKNEVFTWGYTTHLHNVVDGKVGKAIDDLQAIKSYMVKQGLRNGVIARYRTTSEIYELIDNPASYGFDLL